MITAKQSILHQLITKKSRAEDDFYLSFLLLKHLHFMIMQFAEQKSADVFLRPFAHVALFKKQTPTRQHLHAQCREPVAVMLRV